MGEPNDTTATGIIVLVLGTVMAIGIGCQTSSFGWGLISWPFAIAAMREIFGLASDLDDARSAR